MRLLSRAHDLSLPARRGVAALCAVPVLCLAVLAVLRISGGGGPALDATPERVALIAGMVSAAAAILLRARLVAQARVAWLVLGIGAASYAAGFLVSILLLRSGDAGPGWLDDALWAGLYPAAYVGVGLLIRTHVWRFPASIWLDGLIVALAAGAACGAFLLPAFVSDAAAEPVVTIVGQFGYPFADAVLLAMVLLAVGSARRLLSPTSALVVLAFLWLLVGDLFYVGEIRTGTIASALDDVDLNLAWLAGMTSLAFAAWQRSVNVASRWSPRTSVVLAIPTAFMLVAVVVLVYDHHDPVNTSVVYLAAGAIVGAALRTALSYRELRALSSSRREALTDDLTGLPNRRALYAALDRMLDPQVPRRRRDDPAPAPPGGAALLVVDLDRFKELNDTLGHAAGDVLLCQIGERLQPLLGPGSLLARLGGDEFAILLGGAPSDDAALEVGRRARAALSEPFPVEDLRVHVDASIGVALSPRGGESDALMRRADVAMYRAKAERSGVELYAPELDRNTPGRLRLGGELHEAVGTDQIVVHFQPQADPRTGAVVAVEALVRWAHPERGLLPPSAFLPLAVRGGISGPLTEQVLEIALREAAAWHAAGHRLSVSVNLAAPNVVDTALPDKLDRLLAASGVPTGSLTLEVTEDIVMTDPDRAIAVLDELCARGVRLSLDDFGTGHSSLTKLKRLPVEELKIDRTFVMSLPGDRADEAIVRSTISMAHDLGVSVVGEGVENGGAWEMLAHFGASAIQGFYLARPMPAAEFGRWLADDRSELAAVHWPGASPAGASAG